MNGISFAFVLLAVFLPLFDGKPVENIPETLENMKLLRLGNIMSLCELFCESTEKPKSEKPLPESAEIPNVNPRIFCDLCDDEMTTMKTTIKMRKKSVPPNVPVSTSSTSPNLPSSDPSLLPGGGGGEGVSESA